MTLAASVIHPKLAASIPFLEFLVDWEERLPARALREVVGEAGGPDHVAIIGVDLIKGFTQVGPLSGPRVAAIVPRIVRLVEAAHALGVRDFVFVQDAHPQDSPEFAEFPPHCTEGSVEAEMVEALASLPFANLFTIVPKTSIDSAVGTRLPAWLDAHPSLRRIIAVGDCTDLCLYELAMHLQMRAHVHRQEHEVIVPAECADTYDLPVAVARDVGALPHDADLLHRIFLYQMSLNGIDVVRSLR